MAQATCSVSSARQRRGVARSTAYSNGRRLQRLEPGVDAGGIALEQRPVGLGHRRQGRPGAGAEAVQTPLAIDRHQRPAEQRRQLAGAGAAQQVHLEEALLRVQVAGGPGDVGAVAAADRGHAVRVARHADRPAQPDGFEAAVERRQARAHEEPAADERRDHHHEQQPQQRCEPAPAAPASGRRRHRAPPAQVAAHAASASLVRGLRRPGRRHPLSIRYDWIQDDPRCA